MNNTVASRFTATLWVAISLVALSACSTAKVTDTWTSPDISKITFKNVMVIAATSNDANRKAAEDTVVAALPGIKATASHTVIPNASDMNVVKLNPFMKDAGMDGVIVMQLRSDKSVTPPQQEQPLDPAYVGGYSGYSDMIGTYSNKDVAGAGSHAMAETVRLLVIETRLYQLPDGKLVWSGTTESTSPSSVDQLMGDVVKTLKKKMIEDKLIPEPTK
jgi:hypothetical protein